MHVLNIVLNIISCLLDYDTVLYCYCRRRPIAAAGFAASLAAREFLAAEGNARMIGTILLILTSASVWCVACWLMGCNLDVTSVAR